MARAKCSCQGCIVRDAKCSCPRDDICHGWHYYSQPRKWQNTVTDITDWSLRRNNGRRNMDQVLKWDYEGNDSGTGLLRVSKKVWVATSSSAGLKPFQFCKQILVQSWVDVAASLCFPTVVLLSLMTQAFQAFHQNQQTGIFSFAVYYYSQPRKWKLVVSWNMDSCSNCGGITRYFHSPLHRLI